MTGMDFWAIYEWLSPMLVELSFTFFFLLGFALLRFDRILRRFRTRKSTPKVSDEAALEGPLAHLHKSVEADLSAGHSDAVLSLWRSSKARIATPVDTLKLVAQAFLDADPAALVEEIADHMVAHREILCQGRTVTTVLDVIARAGQVKVMEQFNSVMQHRFQLAPSSQTYEVLLGGYASAGDEANVWQLIKEVHAARSKLTPRGFALTIKGFLKNGMVDAAMHQLLEMQAAGFFVPSFAVTQLLRVACDAGRAGEIFARCSELGLPADAVVVLFEECIKRNDLKLALEVEQRARAASVQFGVSAYDALLKILVVHAHVRALDVFQEMQEAGIRISEGLCVGLLARCAESKFLRFAEEVARFVRGRDGMTLAVYSSLMKVYAYCGMYDKACDLYAQIIAAGLEPDSMMYGCLMKFSVECGRTDLSQELFNKAPALEIQNYMSLIRAAGRDKDVNKAFVVLEKLKQSAVAVDIAAYNCVVDACVSSGDMKRARELIDTMKASLGSLDIITYNTLLKGYCTSGDMRAAKDLLAEMSSLGHAPNDVSFNCLINAAVSRGNFREAWQTVEMMEQSGIPVDHYTMSILMKALKRVTNPKDVEQALSLLDRSGLDPCSDEVLLNTLLEGCIRHRELRRLQSLLSSFKSSALQPCVHTYGSLIKACSTLKQVDRCWELWHAMVDERALQPNEIVLGCMLDALVSNSNVEHAVTLFEKWKEVIPPNTVMYCTLIKGFANSRQAGRAMALWREMIDQGTPMNIVVYNSLIDSQARVGDMENVFQLVETMEPNGISPDAISYSTIVKGYCIKGDLDKAFEVFCYMQSNNMVSDCIIYNTVLDGCTRHNRMDLADKILEDMDKHNIKPSQFTLGILTKMYGRRRQLDKAFRVLEQATERHGLRPNAQAKMCLMNTCLHNGDLERALTVFEDIIAHGHGPDAKIYGVLINGIVRHNPGRLHEAVGLIEQACGLTNAGLSQRDAACRRLPPSQPLETETLEQLLQALASRSLMKSVGVPFLERLRAAKVPINSRIVSAFLGQCDTQRAQCRGTQN